MMCVCPLLERMYSVIGVSSLDNLSEPEGSRGMDIETFGLTRASLCNYWTIQKTRQYTNATASTSNKYPEAVGLGEVCLSCHIKEC